MRLHETLLQMYQVPKKEKEKIQNNKTAEFYILAAVH